MLPWEIIGWLILGVVALVVAVLGATFAIGFYLGLRERQRALNTAGGRAELGPRAAA